MLYVMGQVSVAVVPVRPWLDDHSAVELPGYLKGQDEKGSKKSDLSEAQLGRLSILGLIMKFRRTH